MAARKRRSKKSLLPDRVLHPPRSVATLRSDSIASLRIDGSRYDLQARDAFTSSGAERTIEGGSTVTIDVHDRDRLLTGTDFLDADHDTLADNDVLLTIDGLRFALARAEDTHPSYKLVFEDYVVAALKSATRQRKAYRDKVTRAEFIWMLVRELGFNFYCPELKDRQPIARPEKSETAREVKADRKAGFSPGAKITVKGQAASRRQLQVISDCLTEAASLGASEFVMVCVVACITQESIAGDAQQQTGNDDVGIYQQGRNWISAAGAKKGGPATKAFLITGPTSFKRQHGSIKLKSGDVNALVKDVQKSVGGYGPWVSEAKRTVAAFLGGDGGLSLSSGESIDVPQRFAFKVGADGKQESYWACMQRLAAEVGFRCFVVGSTVVYMSEPEMIAQRPAMAIWREAPGIIKLEGDWDRGHTVQEARLSAFASRWGAQPGQCVDVLEPGPLRGRWIVATVSRPELTAPGCDITLKRPQRKKAEPAPETTQVTGDTTLKASTDGRAGDPLAVFDAAVKIISDRTLGYGYGAGHGPKLSTINPAKSKLDCSSSTSLALWAAGLFKGDVAIVSGAFASGYGARGKGKYITVWANGGHVWVERHGSKDYKRFDTGGSGGGSGPKIHNETRSTAGFTARHPPGY